MSGNIETAREKLTAGDPRPLTVHLTRAEADALAADLKAARKAHETQLQINAGLLLKWGATREREKQLREALDWYGWHRDGCTYRGAAFPDSCSCGFAALSVPVSGKDG